MKQSTGCVLLIAAAAFIGACDDDNDNNGGLSFTDKTFVNIASEANKAEIELGQLAAERGSAQVKSFGSQMVTDHTTALTELQTIATQKNADVASGPNDVHMQLKQRLMTYTGYTFDTAYVNSQVKDHETVVGVFSAQQANGQDQSLKDYATKYLPHLNEHLTMANELKAELDAAPPTGTRKTN